MPNLNISIVVTSVFVVMAPSAVANADTSIPYVSSISTKERVEGNNSYVTWTTKGGRIPWVLPQSELDVTCKEFMNSIPFGRGKGCTIGIAVPTVRTVSSENKKLTEFLLARASNANTDVTIGELLRTVNTNTTEDYINPDINGSRPDGGVGCYVLTGANPASVYTDRGNYKSLQSSLTPNINAALNSSCIGVQPAEQWCALTQTDIQLDFGTQARSDKFSTSKITTAKPLTVECTGALKYQIHDIGGNDGVISLNNGGQVQLRIDGAWGRTFQGNAGVTSHTLEGELMGTPTTAGPYYGSTILSVSYP